MITLTREEAQQVLDIMESTHFAVADNVKHSVVMEHVAAIELLRARLAEPEQGKTMDALSELMNLRIEVETLRARIAEPEKEQEPVAWGLQFIDGEYYDEFYKSPDKVEVGECKLVPLYTSPPQREWQGLTDEEIIGTANNAPFDTMVSAEDYIYVIARAIEKALKEKNT